METASVADRDPEILPEGVERRGLTDPLDATAIAINHYRIPPGEGLPGGLHAHADQEEVFVVLSGEATFETLSGAVRVDEGAAIRFSPGAFQSGWNRAGEPLTVLALGAPRETEDTRIPVACADCGHDDLRIESGPDGLAFACPDCGAEPVPRDCPECGHDDLRVRPADGNGTVAVCRGCGAAFDSPPLRN